MIGYDSTAIVTLRKYLKKLFSNSQPDWFLNLSSNFIAVVHRRDISVLRLQPQPHHGSEPAHGETDTDYPSLFFLSSLTVFVMHVCLFMCLWSNETLCLDIILQYDNIFNFLATIDLVYLREKLFCFVKHHFLFIL